MKVVFVTHAKTTNRPPRRLSLAGKWEVEQVVDMLKGELGPGYRITRAVSSSAARCLETAILCLEEVGADDLTRVETDERLARLDDPGKLEGVLREKAQEGLAVFCHADLGGVLPAKLNEGAVRDGWFTKKPVLVVMDWEPGEKWEQSRVLAVKTVPEEISLMAA